MSAYIDAKLGYFAVIFPGVLAAFLLFYAFNLLVRADNENAITETRQAYTYALVGTILIVSAGAFAAAFTNSASLVDTSPLSPVVQALIDFIRAAIAAGLMAAITIQAFTLITSNEESEIQKARKGLFRAMAGVAIVLLAGPMVQVFYGKSTSAGTAEIVGIGNFLATLFGLLAVIAVIAGGLMLVVSVDESLKDRGKKLIFAGIVATIVVFCAFALLNFFL